MIRAINVDLTEGVESDFSEVEFRVGSGGFSTSISFNRCRSRCRCSFNNRCGCGCRSVSNSNRCRQIPSSVSRYRCGKRCRFVDNRCGLRGRCGLVDNRCGQGLVGRCGLGVVFIRTGFTFISYISNETRVAIYPVNNTLDATVG